MSAAKVSLTVAEHRRLVEASVRLDAARHCVRAVDVQRYVEAKPGDPWNAVVERRVEEQLAA